MKKLLIILSTMAIMFADSPVGNWKLSGLRVDYYDIARAPVDFVVTDVYGAGIALTVAQVPAGALFNHTPNGPFNNAALDYAGVNLNVNLYPDGTGVIGEGSYYPDVDLIPGVCATQGLIFPITDDFYWETSGGQEGNSFPLVNLIGLPTYNSWAGQEAFGLGVNGSGVFDNWGSEPIQIPTPSVLPAITPDGVNFLALGCAGICASGSAGPFDECMAGCSVMPEAYGAMLPGAWGGYYRQGDLGNSQMGQELDVKFLLEWSAIDGLESQSGLGDDETDEDGDGSIYDRIFGVPYLSSTFVNASNPLCDITGGALTGAGPGLVYPVAGDIVSELGGEEAVGAFITGSCLQSTADGSYDACIGQVSAGVNGLCEEAGGPVAAVTGLCWDASQSDDFAGACAYYGAATALTVTCLQLGFSEEVCAEAAAQAMPAIDAYCVYATGVDCATAGIDECSILTNSDFALGLCGTLAGALTESETCEEWTASFDESWLDAQAVGVIGATCTDFSNGLQAGLAAGDATTIATIDGLFAGVAGMSCTDYGANYVGMCVEDVSGANDFYVMDLSLETWGLFLTYNGASVQQYLAAGYNLETIAYYFPELFVNDSGWDFDPTCYYTGETCSGRLVMNFEPTCVPEVEAHTIVAEFVDLQALECEGTGDVAGGYDDVNGNGCADCYGYADTCEGWSEEFDCFEGPAGDGIVNVVDVVKLVGHILGTSPLGGYLLCEADLNQDTIVNVVDVVQMVNLILGRAYHEDATEATIVYTANAINIEADGYIGGIDLTVEFTNETFDFELGDHYVGDYTVSGNTARILLVGQNSLDNVINVTSGQIESISNVTVVNSNEEINATLTASNPEAYSIKSAYPNPFNPSTTLEMTLNISADVSVKVYNLTGQLVDVIAEGNFASGNYSWNWNAENLASGAYFISTQVGNEISQQKVMLIK